MFYISQTQKDDCGFACLKMLLANIHNDKNYLFLSQKENHGFYSYADLLEIAKGHGVTLSAIRVTEKSTVTSCQHLPFIATIHLQNGANHAVLVVKVTAKAVTYLDPRRGKVKIKLREFIKVWDSTALIVESFEKKKCQDVIVEPIQKKQKLLLGSIQFIAGIFAVFGVYFIKDDTPIFVPAIFLFLAIITELLMKAYSFKLMKKLDEHFFKEELVPSSGYRNYIERYENYKRLSLSSSLNYILILVFSFALIVIVLLNDIRNVLLVLVPLALAVLDALVIDPIFKKKKANISDLEDDLDNSENVTDLRNRVRIVHNMAYNYSYFNMAITYLYAGFIILTTLLTMRLCGISSFPYIIFYSCIAVTLYRSINQLFSFGDNVEEYNLAKIKLNNAIKR